MCFFQHQLHELHITKFDFSSYFVMIYSFLTWLMYIKRKINSMSVLFSRKAIVLLLEEEDILPDKLILKRIITKKPLSTAHRSCSHVRDPTRDIHTYSQTMWPIQYVGICRHIHPDTPGYILNKTRRTLLSIRQSSFVLLVGRLSGWKKGTRSLKSSPDSTQTQARR